MPSPPLLKKAWQFTSGGISSLNRRVVTTLGQTTFSSEIAFLTKQLLTGFALNPWVVVQSSNGTTAGAADNWASSSNVIYASPGVAHSWIVLQQDKIRTGFQFLLDCSGGFTTITVVVSPGGNFTGGTITNRPTASDEVVLWSQSSAVIWASTADTMAVNAMMSTDGQCTRVLWMGNAFMGQGSNAVNWHSFMFERVLRPSDAWGVDPWFGLSTNLQYRDPIDNQRAWTRVGTQNLALALNVPTAVGSFPSWQPQNDLNRNLVLVDPVGLRSFTAGGRGLWGSIHDLWFTPGWYRTGMGYPVDGYDLVAIGGYLYPWDGSSVPLLS